MGSCREGTQKPSRQREIGLDKSPLHGCKSPHCCYFIYRCPQEDCFLLQKFKLFFFSSLLFFFSPLLASRQWSLIPQCHIQTELTSAPRQGGGAAGKGLPSIRAHRPAAVLMEKNKPFFFFPGNGPWEAYFAVWVRSTAQPSHPACSLMHRLSHNPPALPCCASKNSR